MKHNSFFIVGGAGFIGSHFVDRLLSDPEVSAVTIYDNFSSGREWHYAAHLSDPRFRVERGDVKDLARLKTAMEGHEAVIHLASNPDIARAATEPDIDFREGTLLTNHVVEAMRVTGARTILYASGSGVYGDLGETEAQEDHGPLIPVSTYGASKLAGEALISSYSYMFEITGWAFRFGNVVGPHQTHGVGFDFIRQLLRTPHQLRILGDGTQSKSYIHVEDVVNAVLAAMEKTEAAFRVYNVATGDYITVREIARTRRGSDGPAARAGAFRIHRRQPRMERRRAHRPAEHRPHWRASAGRCRLKTREALRTSMQSMLRDARLGKLWAA